MQNWKIKVSLFLNYFVFAILLNSVGTVILQVQNNYGVTQSAASVLEACKDLSIAIISFLVSSYITRIGYKNAMLVALGFITIICCIMPMTASFGATKLLFIAVGSSFALIKMSVYSTIGLVTKNEKEHISLMNFIESFFMIGILTGYFVFSYFVDNNNPQSTAWLKVYYLLGAISLVAFLLLFSTRVDESSIHSDEKGSMISEFGQMFQLMISPIVLAFIFCAFFYVLIEQSVAVTCCIEYSDGQYSGWLNGIRSILSRSGTKKTKLVYCVGWMFGISCSAGFGCSSAGTESFRSAHYRLGHRAFSGIYFSINRFINRTNLSGRKFGNSEHTAGPKTWAYVRPHHYFFGIRRHHRLHHNRVYFSALWRSKCILLFTNTHGYFDYLPVPV